LGRQMAERLAHRNPADLKLRSDRVLAQLLAFPQFTAKNFPPQPLQHSRRQGLARNLSRLPWRNSFRVFSQTITGSLPLSVHSSARKTKSCLIMCDTVSSLYNKSPVYNFWRLISPSTILQISRGFSFFSSSGRALPGRSW